MVGRIGTIFIAAALIAANAPARAAEIHAMITTAMGAAIDQLAGLLEGIGVLVQGFRPPSLLAGGACLAWGLDNNLTRHLSAADPVRA